MAWIESHQQLERHPKVHALMNLMGWDLDTTIGKLHRFWWWCLDFAPTGDLRGKNDALLAGSVGLAAPEGARFVAAMVESCWIDRSDGVFRVHDWLDYAGRYLRDSKFRRQPESWREAQDLFAPDPPKRQPTVGRQSAVPDLTNQPTRGKPPNPLPPLPTALDVPAFRSAWERWQQHRREIRKPLKPTMAAGQLARCEGWGVEHAVRVIEHTIAQGWQGFREPEEPRRGPAGNGARPRGAADDEVVDQAFSEMR